MGALNRKVDSFKQKLLFTLVKVVTKAFKMMFYLINASIVLSQRIGRGAEEDSVDAGLAQARVAVSLLGTLQRTGL